MAQQHEPMTHVLCRLCSQATAPPPADGWSQPVIFEYQDPKEDSGTKGVFFAGKEIKLGVGDWVLKVDNRNNQWFVDTAVKDDKIKPRYVSMLLSKARAVKSLGLSSG